MNNVYASTSMRPSLHTNVHTKPTAKVSTDNQAFMVFILGITQRSTVIRTYRILVTVLTDS